MDDAELNVAGWGRRNVIGYLQEGNIAAYWGDLRESRRYERVVSARAQGRGGAEDRSRSTGRNRCDGFLARRYTGIARLVRLNAEEGYMGKFRRAYGIRAGDSDIQGGGVLDGMDETNLRWSVGRTTTGGEDAQCRHGKR